MADVDKRDLSARWLRCLLAALLLLAVVASGCQSRDRGQGSPGNGSTIADRVFTAVAPHAGELSSSPNPTLESTPIALRVRVVRVCKQNPSWAYHVRFDPRERNGRLRYSAYDFQDGSILTFVESPLPGPHNIGAGPDTGYTLDYVEIVR